MGFETFDSFDAMLDRMGQAERQAEAQIQNWQQELLVAGSYAIRTLHGLVLFHEIMEYPIDEVEDSERERLTRNYVFSRGYSVACPMGELGDAHKATFLAVVSKEFFEAARVAGWGIVSAYNTG